MASKTRETSHSTDELSAQETAHDATQDPVMDEDDPLLELLNYSQDTSSQTQEQEAIPDRPMPTTRTPKIKWPKTSEKAPWKQFDEDIYIIFESSMQGPVHRKLHTLTTLVYSVAKERFGIEEAKNARRLQNRTGSNTA